jgi:hypothetical protein
MYEVNEHRICWFSRFEFPEEKSLCNVCIFHCIFHVLLLKMFVVKYCTRLKYTKLDLVDDIDISSIFNVVYLYAYHENLEEDTL